MSPATKSASNFQRKGCLKFQNWNWYWCCCHCIVLLGNSIKLSVHKNWYKEQNENHRSEWCQVISCNTTPHWSWWCESKGISGYTVRPPRIYRLWHGQCIRWSWQDPIVKVNGEITRTYIRLFSELGKSFQLSDELVNNLQEFVCKMYGKEITDIDLLRYKLYCSKKGKCKIERLPPCMAALRQHCLRANYQTRVWRLCHEQTPAISHHQLIMVGCLMKME